MPKTIPTCCPKCKSTDLRKNGFMNKKQRYLCKSCRYTFTSFTLERGHPKAVKQQVIDWYLEGSSMRSIERRLGVSIGSVINWIREAAKELPEVEDMYQKKQ